MKTLYDVIVGSHLYGTANENSDRDTRYVFIQDVNTILGLEGQRGGPNYSLVELGQDREGKEFRKWVSQCVKGNPNILDALFAPEKFWISYDHNYMGPIIAARKFFIGKHISNPFLGHAYSCLTALRDSGQRKRGRGTNAKRNSSIEQYGYDVKDAAHLVRLLLQHNNICTTMWYNPCLEGEQLAFVRAIRAGDVTLEDVLNWAEEHFKKESETDYKLPEIKIDKINNIVVEIMQYHIRKGE